jgi:hypothetical protein
MLVPNFLVVVLASYVIAHPNHNVRDEIEEREAALAGLPRGLEHCAEEMRARGLIAKAAARRAQLARRAREERGLDTSKGYNIVSTRTY